MAQVGSAGNASIATGVKPPTPWLTLAPAGTLTRIGVGSCLDQRHPQPIWRAVLAARPQLFLMIGDNVYGDVKAPELAELKAAYHQQGRHPEFAKVRGALPFLAVWDDHDFGLNDGGRDFRYAGAAKALFHEFWQTRPEREVGVHSAEIFGPPGRRVQIILLDTRSFRSALKPKTSAFAHWGRYEPDPDPGKTVLGSEQWAWLESELGKPADIRLLASSIQVLAEGHGFERWGNLPAERDRLLGLIDRSRARGLVLLSGDRHSGALYRSKTPGGRLLVEMTTSSLNRSYGPSKDARVPPLVGEPYHPENFGLVDIDWSARTIQISLRAMDGGEVGRQSMTFADLGHGP